MLVFLNEENPYLATYHAQGASYLRSVLEKVGILEWNGKSYRIKWRLRDTDISIENIEGKLQKINL